MARRPLILITTYAENDQGSVTLPANYIQAVRRAGGIPLLVAPGETHMDELLGRADGCVLAGGGDICPTRYGGALHETIYMVDLERDEMEMAIARQLIEQQVPTLAICRGLQIVNVALGGSLYEHLPEYFGNAVAHRAPPREPTPHPVAILAESRLATLTGVTSTEPMSWHHQALRHVASPLTVVAHAPDGVVEAVEIPSHRWFLGVQWHPEITAACDPIQQQLFDELVRQAIASA